LLFYLNYISINTNIKLKTQVTIAALISMKRDFISTGKCDLTMAKQKEFAPALQSTVL
jgi:hypothetical protein